MEHRSSSWRTDVALLLMRLMLGAVFVFHGVGKLRAEGGVEAFAANLEKMGIPSPLLGAYAATFTELIGGILLIIGIVVELAVVPMVVTMLVASFKVHGGAFDAREGGMEYPLTLAVMLVALGLMGAGRLTLFGMGKHLSKSDHE